MKLRQSLNWLLERYMQKLNGLEMDAESQMIGVSCLTGQIIAYKTVIKDLTEILEGETDD